MQLCRIRKIKKRMLAWPWHIFLLIEHQCMLELLVPLARDGREMRDFYAFTMTVQDMLVFVLNTVGISDVDFDLRHSGIDINRQANVWIFTLCVFSFMNACKIQPDTQAPYQVIKCCNFLTSVVQSV